MGPIPINNCRIVITQNQLPERQITIRIDDDLLAWFREQAHASGGGSYQTLINAALREHVASRKEPLEEMLRTVVREELEAYGEKARR